MGACIYACYFRPYELCLLGLLLDVSYGTSSFGLLPFPFVYTLGACILVIVSEGMRPYIRLA